MKNLNSLYRNALDIISDENIPYGKIVSISVNALFTNKWGRCTCVGCSTDGENEYKIEISKELLYDDVLTDFVLTVIMHEILHTCENCMNHGLQWQQYADQINQKYKERFCIRQKNQRDFKLIPFHDDYFKYVIKCSGCGYKFGYMQRCAVVKASEYGECICRECGSRFILIKGNRSLHSR